MRIWRYLFAFWQRGTRGWADEDAWSFDHYLSKVVAGGMSHMAKNAHGCPAEFLPGWPDRTKHTHEELVVACDVWQMWLEDKAAWFEWYTHYEDDLEGILEADNSEKKAIVDKLQDKLDRFYDEVMVDWGKHFGSLWD